MNNDQDTAEVRSIPRWRSRVLGRQFRPTLRWLWPVMVLPGLIFAGCVLYFGVDAPYIDDFHLYNFIYRFDQTGDPRWFLTQTNEHRAVFARVLVWATECLTGRVNLLWYMAFSALVLGGLTVLLARAFQSMGVSWAWFLPVPFLVFQTQGWSNYYWAFCAISNVAVIGFVALSLYWVRTTDWRFGAASALGVLATFTMGSGLMVFVAGTLVLQLQRRWRAVGLWMATAGVSSALYLYDFKHPERVWTLDTLSEAVPKGFTYLGNFTDFADQSSEAMMPVSLVTGFGLVGVALWRFWREEVQGERWMPRPTFLFLTGLLTYVAGTAILVALNRASMVENRYKINSVLFLAVVYLLVVPAVRRLPNRNWYGVIPLGLAMLFFSFTYVRYLPDVITFRHEALGELFSRQNGGTGAGDPFLARIQYLEKKGAYRLPAGYGRTFGPLKNRAPEPVSHLNSAFPGLKLTVDSTKITLVDRQQRWSNDPNEGLWVLLDAPGAQFTWRSARKSTGLRDFLRTGQLFSPGATCDVYAGWLRPARYRILVYRSGPTPRLVATNRFFEGRGGRKENWLD